MKSPFTSKDMEIVYEVRTWNFRGEQYEYTHAAYRCVDTGEQFTSEEMEEAGYLQVTNQYRIKYGLPFTDEIADVRNRYGLSAAKMAQIMGFPASRWFIIFFFTRGISFTCRPSFTPPSLMRVQEEPYPFA